MEGLSRHFGKQGVSNAIFKMFKSSVSIGAMAEKIADMGFGWIGELERMQCELVNTEIIPIEVNVLSGQTKPKLARRIASDGLVYGLFPVRVPEENSIWASISYALGHEKLPSDALYALCCHVFVQDSAQICEDYDTAKIFDHLRKNKCHKLILVKLLAAVIRRDIIVYNYSNKVSTLIRYMTNKDGNKSPIFISYKNGRFNPLEQSNPFLTFGFESVLSVRPLFNQPHQEPFRVPAINQQLDDLMVLNEDKSEEGIQNAKEAFSNNVFLDDQRMDLVRWRYPVENIIESQKSINEQLLKYTSFFLPLQTSGNGSTLIEAVATALTGNPKFSKPLLVLFYQHIQNFQNISVVPSTTNMDLPYKSESIGRVAMILFRRICVFTIIQSGIRCDVYTPPFVVFQTTINILNHFGKFHALVESPNPVWTTNNCIVYSIQVDFIGNERDKFQYKVSMAPTHINKTGFPPPNLTMYTYSPTSSHHIISQILPTELEAMEILAKMSVGLLNGTPEDKINRLKEIFIKYAEVDWNRIVSICHTLPMAVWDKRSQYVVTSPDITILVRHGLETQFSPEYAGDDARSLFKAISIAMFGTTCFQYRLRLICVYLFTKEHTQLEGITTTLRLSMPSTIYDSPLSYLLHYEAPKGDDSSAKLSKYLLSILFRRNIYVLKEIRFGESLQLDVARIGFIGDHIEMNGIPIYILSVEQRTSLLLTAGNQTNFEVETNHVIGTLSEGFGPRTRPDEITAIEINSDNLLTAANEGLQRGEHPQFLTHSRFGLMSSFPLSLAFSREYLQRTTVICNGSKILSTGIIYFEAADKNEVVCPMDLDQLMKQDGLGSLSNVELALKMEHMLYEGKHDDFHSLPLSENTLYKYSPSSDDPPDDILNNIKTQSDTIFESDDDYYIGVSGSIIPLQLNRLLTSVAIKNYGTCSVYWIIVCKNHTMRLARLLQKLTHQTGMISECQLAYDQVIFMTMHTLQRNGIPFHFRNHEPGETIVIRSGSYYQGICTGIVVIRKKTTILADYSLLSNDWELIPSCRCHPGERSVFIDAVKRSKKNFRQSQSCRSCTTLEFPIPTQHPARDSTSNVGILRIPVSVTTPIPALPKRPMPKLVPAPTTIVQLPVNTIKQQVTADKEKSVVVQQTRLYPNLENVDHEQVVENTQNNEEHDVENIQENWDDDDDGDDTTGEADMLDHSYDPSYTSVREFHEWLGLIPTAQASQLVKFTGNPIDYKTLWITFRKKFDKKHGKKLSSGTKTVGKSIISNKNIKETVDQKYSRLYDEMFERERGRIAREEEFVRGIPDTMNAEFIEIMRATWQQMMQAKSNTINHRVITRSMHSNMIPAIQPPALPIAGPSGSSQTSRQHDHPITNSQNEQHQRPSQQHIPTPPADLQIERTSPVTTPLVSSTASIVMGPGQGSKIVANRESRRSSMTSQQGDESMSQPEPVAGPSSRKRASANTEPEHTISLRSQNKKTLVATNNARQPRPQRVPIVTRSKSTSAVNAVISNAPDSPNDDGRLTQQQSKPRTAAAAVEPRMTRSKSKSTAMLKPRRNDNRIDPSLNSSDDEDDAADRKRRKSVHFDIGPLPIDDEARPRTDGLGQYRRIYPGKQGTYLTFQYKIDKNKRVICHGPCCNGTKKFSLAANFRKHVNDMTGRFSCDECELTFPRKESLERHQVQQHPIEPPNYVCDNCQKRFTHKRNLDRHIRSDVCNNDDSDSSEVQDSEDSSHNEEEEGTE